MHVVLKDRISLFFQPSQFGVACKASAAKKIVHNLRNALKITG